MTKLLVLFAASFGSLAVGALLAAALRSRLPGVQPRLDRLSVAMKFAGVFVVSVLPTVSSLWGLRVPGARLAFVPLLGVLAVASGGAGGLLASRLLRLAPARAASMFCCGLFTNLGTLGSLAAFVFFGEHGFAIAQVYTLFEQLTYYAVGFPMVDRIVRGGGGRLVDLSVLRRQPAMFIPLAAMAAGGALNLLGLPRPAIVPEVSGVLIILNAVLLGLAIGLTLHVGTIGRYGREVGLAAVIKFALVPALVIPAAWALGLGGLEDGLTLKVVALLAFMPVGILALVPPTLYGGDLDLANSGWLATTAAMLGILPLLAVILG
jgi:predicted permease